MAHLLSLATSLSSSVPSNGDNTGDPVDGTHHGTEYYFVAAIVCSCVGSFGISMSLILMKIANIKVEYARDPKIKFYCQKEWIAGLVILIVASTFNYSK